MGFATLARTVAGISCIGHGFEPGPKRSLIEYSNHRGCFSGVWNVCVLGFVFVQNGDFLVVKVESDVHWTGYINAMSVDFNEGW